MVVEAEQDVHRRLRLQVVSPESDLGNTTILAEECFVLEQKIRCIHAGRCPKHGIELGCTRPEDCKIRLSIIEEERKGVFEDFYAAPIMDVDSENIFEFRRVLIVFVA